MAHLGADRTLKLIREMFYWSRMEEDVRHFISHQCPCVGQKKPHIQSKAPILPIISSAPLDIVRIDFLHLKKSSGGYQYILLITDHFTRYTQAYPTPNETAKTVSTHFYNDLVLHFDIPSQLLHNQGGKFENALFKYLANLLGVQTVLAM